MDAQLLKVGSDVSAIDKTVRNEWRWAWLNETGENGKPFSLWCKNLNLPGVCMCMACHKKIQYSSNGKKFLMWHQLEEKHKAAVRSPQNTSFLPGATATTTEAPASMGVTVCVAHYIAA